MGGWIVWPASWHAGALITTSCHSVLPRVRRLNLTFEGHLLTVLQRGYPAVAAALAAAGLLVRGAWDCLAV